MIRLGIKTPGWMKSAACRTDPQFTERPVPQQLGVCADCPVRTDCLEFGLTQIPAEPRDCCVYGGLTPVEVVAAAAGKRIPVQFNLFDWSEAVSA